MSYEMIWANYFIKFWQGDRVSRLSMKGQKNGDLWRDTTENKTYTWQDGLWIELGSGESPTPPTPTTDTAILGQAIIGQMVLGKE